MVKYREGPDEVAIEDWRRQMEKQIGKERLQEGLFISIPYFCTSDKANDFLVDQLKKIPGK